MEAAWAMVVAGEEGAAERGEQGAASGVRVAALAVLEAWVVASARRRR